MEVIQTLPPKQFIESFSRKLALSEPTEFEDRRKLLETVGVEVRYGGMDQEAEIRLALRLDAPAKAKPGSSSTNCHKSLSSSNNLYSPIPLILKVRLAA